MKQVMWKNLNHFKSQRFFLQSNCKFSLNKMESQTKSHSLAVNISLALQFARDVRNNSFGFCSVMKRND